MSRPTNKPELLAQCKINYGNLLDFIDSLPIQKREGTFPEGYLNRNIRDVLAHLHQWHLMAARWYKEGMAGNKPDMPAKGYTWKTMPELNREIQKKYSRMEFEKVKLLLAESHQKMNDIITRHSNDELFEKKRYAWTGSTSMAAYLTSATSSHYDWALKLIKKCTNVYKGR